MRVWLSAEEMEQLIDEANGPQQKIPFLLAGQCGLRQSEITQVCPQDLVTGPTGKHVRIWEDYAKREHYREPPVPETLFSIVETFAWDRADNAPVVDAPTSTSIGGSAELLIGCRSRRVTRAGSSSARTISSGRGAPTSSSRVCCRVS
ncbi:hypothetical protein [Haloarcula sp. JP-L23]|uniref:hypothetical protein n=1 Tax=Haloarcula sp. JP-L23 TaxID=2716717 RepID=UPI001D050D1A